MKKTKRQWTWMVMALGLSACDASGVHPASPEEPSVEGKRDQPGSGNPQVMTVVASSKPDMRASTTAYFYRGPNLISVEQVTPAASFSIVDKWGYQFGKALTSLPRSAGGGAVLLDDGVEAVSAWAWVLPPIQMALTIASIIAPELTPAAIAMGGWSALFNTAGVDAAAGSSPPLIPAPLQNAADSASPYYNVGNLLRLGVNYALDLSGDGYDRTAASRGVLNIDRSKGIDRVVIEYDVDTTRGDPIGWVRTAPVSPGGALSGREGVMIEADRLQTWDRRHRSKARITLYPTHMPVGSFDMVMSSKETDCDGCLSIVQHLKVSIARNCVDEGLSPIYEPSTYLVSDCRHCSMFERLGPGRTVPWTCVSCGPGGYQDPANIQSCVQCTGNQIVRTGVSTGCSPSGCTSTTRGLCGDCPAQTRANSRNSVCVPTVCDTRALGFYNSTLYSIGQTLGNATCEDKGRDLGAGWTRNCRVDQYYELDRCYNCPIGQVGLAGAGRSSCVSFPNRAGTPRVPTGTVTSLGCFGAIGTAQDEDRPGGSVDIQVYGNGPHPAFAEPGVRAGTLIATGRTSGSAFSVPFRLGPAVEKVWVYALDQRYPGWNRRLNDPSSQTFHCTAIDTPPRPDN